MKYPPPWYEFSRSQDYFFMVYIETEKIENIWNIFENFTIISKENQRFKNEFDAIFLVRAHVQKSR